MGLFDKIKKGIESAVAHAKMDDFLIAEIDKIITQRWRKVSERKPIGIAGISLEDESEYNFVYDANGVNVRVEMEHEFPYVEVEMSVHGRKIETKIKVSEFVEKKGTELYIKNKDRLEKIIQDMMDRIQ